MLQRCVETGLFKRLKIYLHIIETFVIPKPRFNVKFTGKVKITFRYFTEITEINTKIFSRESIIELLAFRFKLLFTGKKNRIPDKP